MPIRPPFAGVAAVERLVTCSDSFPVVGQVPCSCEPHAGMRLNRRSREVRSVRGPGRADLVLGPFATVKTASGRTAACSPRGSMMTLSMCGMPRRSAIIPVAEERSKTRDPV